MKVAIITDQHFGARNSSKFFLDNIERFYIDVFFPTLQEREIGTLWILGDTWEDRKNLNINTFHRARKMFFDRLEEMGIQVFIIYGNHDVFFKNTNEVNSIDFLAKMYKNIRVIRTHEVIEFDGTPVGFISWVNNSNLEESLEFIRTAPCSILCGHFDIKTFEMVKGMVSEHGFDKEIFNRYDLVFSGHYHTISTDGRIHYLSNTNQTNWSDHGLKKGFRVFDTETRELEMVENPFWVYGKISYEDDLNILDFDYTEFRNKIVRVYVKSFAGCNQQKLALFLERLNQFTHATDVFETETTVLNTDVEASEFDPNNMKNVIEKYIDDVVQSESLDKPKLKTYFFDLFEEASNSTEKE